MTQAMRGLIGLVGGAEWTDSCTFDAMLLEVSKTDLVSILPTAAAYEYPEMAIETAKGHFEKFDAKVDPIMILNRSDASDEKWLAKLANSRFIYLGGGSPHHLRSVLWQSPALDAIVAAWKNGATVVGSSGGGMVLTDPMVDPRGGAFTVGLGLLKKIAFIPHYSQWSSEKRERTHYLEGAQFVTVGVDESNLLYRSSDGKFELIGSGEFEAYFDGSRLELDDLEFHVEV
ncbi:MAG: Type 1 glutamine amidotransferase-like domain-containing protein [Actinomycetota bacterium]|nr:Type 1 glutamine amidotransferase-like domain-containing protein [Actinomycetota bacterium]